MKLLSFLILIGAGMAPLYSQGRAPARNNVVVDDDGTVHVPAQTVPMSGSSARKQRSTLRST